MNELEIHEKGWGQEHWINNSNGYCGKFLVFESNKKLSWHYHKLKHETFYCMEGKLTLLYGESDDTNLASNIILEPGIKFSIYPGLRHQLIAHKKSKVLEISTTHFEYDSYRIIKGD